MLLSKQLNTSGEKHNCVDQFHFKLIIRNLKWVLPIDGYPTFLLVSSLPNFPETQAPLFLSSKFHPPNFLTPNRQHSLLIFYLLTCEQRNEWMKGPCSLWDPFEEIMQQNKGTLGAISMFQAYSKLLLAKRDQLPKVTACHYCYQKIVSTTFGDDTKVKVIY